MANSIIHFFFHFYSAFTLINAQKKWATSCCIKTELIHCVWWCSLFDLQTIIISKSIRSFADFCGIQGEFNMSGNSIISSLIRYVFNTWQRLHSAFNLLSDGARLYSLKLLESLDSQMMRAYLLKTFGYEVFAPTFLRLNIWYGTALILIYTWSDCWKRWAFFFFLLHCIGDASRRDFALVE